MGKRHNPFRVGHAGHDTQGRPPKRGQPWALLQRPFGARRRCIAGPMIFAPETTTSRRSRGNGCRGSACTTQKGPNSRAHVGMGQSTQFLVEARREPGQGFSISPGPSQKQFADLGLRGSRHRPFLLKIRVSESIALPVTLFSQGRLGGPPFLRPSRLRSTAHRRTIQALRITSRLRNGRITGGSEKRHVPLGSAQK